MLIPIRCEFCGRRQNVTPNMAGQQVVCRNCGGQNVVPGSPPAAEAHGDAGEAEAIGGPVGSQDPPPLEFAARAASRRRAAGARSCPYCAESIEPGAPRCPSCGEQLARGRAGDRDTTALNNAANLSLILGIVSWAVCPLAAPFAIIKGNEARRMAAHSGAAVPVASTIGLILGWVWVGFFILWLGFFVLAVLLEAL